VVLAYQEIGYVCLEALLAAGADVALVLTHPDDPDEEVWFRSVAGLASGRGIEVLFPDDPGRPEVLDRVATAGPDFIFSFYYRYMLPAAFLDLARRGAFNLHGSLLPRYRGRAPVNWALIHGETETGLTLHRMTPRPDDGPIVAQVRVPIDETDTAADLYAKMVPAAAGLVAETWPRLADGTAEETPQDESRASYFGRRRPEDGRIDWQWDARRVYNLIRAVTHPYPGAFTYHGGRKLIVWAAGYQIDAAGTAPPGTVLGNEPRGLAVAAGRGRVFIESAAFEGQAERPGHLLDLNAGDQLGP
jgi:UDP-4-amino-4-deoxy-L-arabinose formyltransferase/UDP-glucuronic acid dehydrogenase (UDP-4-keto-hexauronic acid decarboxylating)